MNELKLSLLCLSRNYLLVQLINSRRWRSAQTPKIKEIETRVLNVIKAYDKVTADKVDLPTSISFLFLYFRMYLPVGLIVVARL